MIRSDMKKFILMLLLAMSSVCFGAEKSEIWKQADRWSPNNSFSKADGAIFTTEVPAGQEEAQNWMECEIDLTPFRGSVATFAVKYRSFNVSKPSQDYNGVKFMLKYRPKPESGFRWPGDSRLSGTTNGWQWTSFGDFIPETATVGTLVMGLQNSHGKVQFDLDTLRIGSLFSVANRINLDWKVEYPERIAKHRRQRGVMAPESIKYEDLKTLREWNVNLVRAQLVRNWGAVGTEVDLAEYDRWLDEKLDNLEKALEWAKEFDIKFIIDLHCLPGGRNSGSNMRMFVEEKYGDHFIEVWKRISHRFNGHPQVYAYDLVNEPLQTLFAPEGYDYWNLQRRAAEAIRKIDAETPIMIESNMADKSETFSYLSPLAMHNIIYKVHMYDPSSFTHQRLRGKGGIVTYPGMIEGEMWNKERIRQNLQPVLEFQKRHNCKIYVGEFSAIAWAPGAEKYLNDCIEIFEEYGWDWTYHAFREWVGWSVEHEGPNASEMKPVDMTPRQKVLRRYFRQNER